MVANSANRGEFYTILPVIWNPSQPWVRLYMEVQIYYRIWNCGKNLSQISLCVVEVKTDHSIPQPRVLDTLLVYPKTTLPDNRTSRAIFSSKHVVWVSTLFASCECYLLKSAWVKESARVKLLLIFQSFGFGFCGFFPGSKSAQAKDWVHRFID